MLSNIARFLRKFSFIKRNKLVKKILKKSSLFIAKLIYGEKKEVKIANQYSFYLDSTFAFSNYENWGEGHNSGFSKLVELSKGKKTVFDIGGHVGLCTLPMSLQIAPEGKIYTFEPSDLNRKYLKKHLEYNSIDNVEVISDLLGNEDDTDVDFYELVDVSGTPSIVNVKEGFQKVSKHQITLDSFCKKNNLVPDLLKIDVEGAEFFVMQGAGNIIKQYKPDIILSLHPKHLKELGIDVNFIFDFAQNFGYEIYDCSTMEMISNGLQLLLEEYYLKAK